MFQEYEDKRRKDGFFTKVRSDQNRNDEIVILDKDKHANGKLIILEMMIPLDSFDDKT